MPKAHATPAVIKLDAHFETLEAALRKVLHAGLPVRPDNAPPELLELACVTARSVNPDDQLARVDALDRLLRSELRQLGLADLRRAAGQLFGIGRGGTSLTERRRQAAITAGYEFDHFRKRIEPKILRQLAWQIYRDSLQYIQRTQDGGPFAASGDTPTIAAEQLENTDDARREILLSRIWSDVYGLRAELITRETTHDDEYQRAEHKEAADGALWYLARLLTNLNHYLDRYGQGILHGSATYNVEALIRLAGWTGDVTPEQARNLRFLLATTGEWNRNEFSKRVRGSQDTASLQSAGAFPE